MADMKISQLGAASAVNDADVFPMTASGVTVKASAATLKNYMGVGGLATDIAATRQMIAPIESDATSSSQSYAIGEQFILNGLLSKAKTAIAQNDAFVLNGNYELADNVTEQINKEKIYRKDSTIAFNQNGQGMVSFNGVDQTTNDIIILSAYRDAATVSDTMFIPYIHYASDNKPYWYIKRLSQNLEPDSGSLTIIIVYKNVN